jgi:carboxyl-terminal processing protease
MKFRPIRYAVFALVIVVLLVVIFTSGVLVGAAVPDQMLASIPVFRLLHPSTTHSQSNSPQFYPESLDNIFKPFWETWDIVHKQYVEQPVDDVLMMRGAIKGMLESLGDPHTSYMDPEQFRQQNTPLVGEYEGIGAWVDVTGEFLTIVNPMPGSPAENAGIEPGDVIIAVDGKDMKGIDPNLVLRSVLGPAGSQVTLTIRREGQEKPFDVTLTRKKIDVPSVEGKMLEDNIAYIHIFTFGDKTETELHDQLETLLANNPLGLILDLRNNGGGYLNTAISVVSEFIPRGKIVMYEEFGDGQQNIFEAKRGGIGLDIPLVVLVNEGTASASEITAGAIQDYERGKLVGTTTFGKGSVQNWIPLANDQGAVRVTIARWLTPKKRQIHNVGLEPDYKVGLTEENIKNNQDVQLEKAVELLK